MTAVETRHGIVLNVYGIFGHHKYGTFKMQTWRKHFMTPSVQACIDRRFHSSVFKEDIETVLACLDYLSNKMGEPLFVPITQEQAAAQASRQASVQR